jgi:hypothetical protein
METRHSPDAALEHQLDPELRLVADAIAMVARGASPRVTVAGLGLREAGLERARRLATAAGVALVPLMNDAGSGLDVSVQLAQTAAASDARPAARARPQLLPRAWRMAARVSVSTALSPPPFAAATACDAPRTRPR